MFPNYFKTNTSSLNLQNKDEGVKVNSLTFPTEQGTGTNMI